MGSRLGVAFVAKMNDSMLVAARRSDLKVSGDSVWARAGLARDRRGQA